MLWDMSGAQNKVADALSCWVTVLSSLRAQVVGFDTFMDLYDHDPDFSTIWAKLQNKPVREYSLHNGICSKDLGSAYL